ncbi:hypothetical protein EC973_008504 [Apophysomyces ossiformis]|uniref:Uncharacterized protein n=1 Tax=Apophysomyces ossiformis TaxID=679940 RepID=A0A8H7BMX3_9FUNG|nr:hypothetical protein EC973_008504 [Apophysomyces ossiformis]
MKLSTHSHHHPFSAYSKDLGRRQARPSSGSPFAPLPACSNNVHQGRLKLKDCFCLSLPELPNDECIRYLEELRQEAYSELHQQMQSYNDTFVAHMRQLEETQCGKLEDLGSMASSSYSSSSSNVDEEEAQEQSMQALIEMFEAGSVKDYSPLLEWELCQNPQCVIEDQGGCGDLW